MTILQSLSIKALYKSSVNPCSNLMGKIEGQAQHQPGEHLLLLENTPSIERTRICQAI